MVYALAGIALAAAVSPSGRCCMTDPQGRYRHPRAQGAPKPGPFRVISLGPARMPGVPADVQRLDYAGSADGTPDWALLVPPADSARLWVVFLHGHGSQGDQLFTRPDIRDGWLPEFRRLGLGILSPNLRGNAWMSPQAASDLHDLLEWVRRRHAARRFILAGGSMGGSSALAYASLHPGDAAAVIALCPAADIGDYQRSCAASGEAIHQEIGLAIRAAYAGEADEIAAVYDERSAVRHAARLTMPVFVCHGAKDAVIPIAGARRLARSMEGRVTFRYVELPDGDHEAPLAEMPRGLGWVMAALKAGR